MNRYYNYDPNTGEVTHKPRNDKKWDARFAGKSVGAKEPSGYIKTRLHGKAYRVHQIAWELYYGKPANMIDHINGDRSDNRIGNLREVVPIDNQRNMKKFTTNTSGYVGISWDKKNSKWIAVISVKGKSKTLGRFTELNDAIAVRKQAEIDYNFHANHGR